MARFPGRLAPGVILLAAAATGADDLPLRGAFERSIDIAAPGRVVLTLDRDVYERARADLGDLRVLDDREQAVPYLLEVATVGEGPLRPPRLLNRVFVRGESSSVTLDFGEPALKSELTLALTGGNFRRRVKVEGQNRQGTEWQTLTDGAYVFAVPGRVPARYETVALPENDFQFLRATVYTGPDDTEPVGIEGAFSRGLERRRPREETLPLSLRVVEDGPHRETQVLADLGARHQPCRGLVLEVADPEFFRGVLVEARLDPARPGQEPGWVAVSESSIYRYRDGDRLYEKLRLDLAGRRRTLRLRIRNLDDRPLTLRSLSLVRPVERLVFEAQPGRRYRLTYGNELLAAPAYDIARTVGDPALWIAQAGAGRLGASVGLPAAAVRLPWTERHPVLVWTLLATLVVVLGGITWQALRTTS